MSTWLMDMGSRIHGHNLHNPREIHMYTRVIELRCSTSGHDLMIFLFQLVKTMLILVVKCSSFRLEIVVCVSQLQYWMTICLSR